MDLNAMLQKVSEMARAGVRLTPEGRTAPGWPNAVLDAVAGQLAPAAEVSGAIAKGELPPAGAALETALNVGQIAPVGKAIAIAKALVGGKAALGASIFGARAVGGEAVLQAAQQMLDSGATPRAVREATGVFRGPADKMLRGEFSDKGAFVKDLGLHVADWSKRNDMQSLPRRLDEVLHHPELFAKYPEFADTQVRFRPGTGSSAGIYSYKEGQAPYNMDIGTTDWTHGGTASPEQLLTHILHENTHITQAAEGYANGGAPKMMFDQKTYEDAKQALKEIEYDHQLATHIKNGLSPAEAYVQTPGAQMSVASGVWAKLKAGAPPGPILRDLELELQAQQKHLDTMKNAVGPTKTEAYMRLPGEVEARMVPDRMNLSLEELRQQPPSQYMDRTLAEQLLGNMGLRGAELPARPFDPLPKP